MWLLCQRTVKTVCRKINIEQQLSTVAQAGLSAVPSVELKPGCKLKQQCCPKKCQHSQQLNLTELPAVIVKRTTGVFSNVEKEHQGRQEIFSRAIQLTLGAFLYTKVLLSAKTIFRADTVHLYYLSIKL